MTREMQIPTRMRTAHLLEGPKLTSIGEYPERIRTHTIYTLLVKMLNGLTIVENI